MQREGIHKTWLRCLSPEKAYKLEKAGTQKRNAVPNEYARRMGVRTMKRYTQLGGGVTRYWRAKMCV